MEYGKLEKYLSLLAALLMGLSIGIVLCLGSLRSGNLKISAAQPSSESSEEYAAGIEKYTEIMELVDNYFIGEDVDENVINDAVASGIISALGDRWSYYISADEYSTYVDSINNSYVGIGVTISASLDADDNLLGYEIIDVTEGGPADEAGILVGDIMVAVEDLPTSEMSVSEVKSLVRGKENTSVSLTLQRGDAVLTLDVERRSFYVTPAEGEMLRNHTAYIQIDNFDSGCAQTVISLLEDLMAQGAESVVFDVRNNPGGLKTELTDLLDYLLPEGTIFHSVDYTGAEEIVTSDASCVDIPMVVLVNADTYSAAEYFACALQEYDAAEVVGEQTYGKGYYQVGLTLSDGSCVNLSVGKYYTPSGISLIDVGVTPDYEIVLEDDLAQELLLGTLEADTDPQLQQALTLLPD